MGYEPRSSPVPWVVLSWKERGDVIVWPPLDRKERCSRASLPLGGSRGLVYLESRLSHAAPLFSQAQSALHPLGPRFCTSRRRRPQLERPRHVSMLRWHGGGYTTALTTLAIKTPNDSMYDTIQGCRPWRMRPGAEPMLLELPGHREAEVWTGP